MIRNNASEGIVPAEDGQHSHTTMMPSSGAPLVTVHMANLARLARQRQDVASLIQCLCGSLPKIAQLSTEPLRLRDGDPAGGSRLDPNCWLQQSEIHNCGDGNSDLCVFEWWQCSDGSGYWVRHPAP